MPVEQRAVLTATLGFAIVLRLDEVIAHAAFDTVATAAGAHHITLGELLAAPSATISFGRIAHARAS